MIELAAGVAIGLAISLVIALRRGRAVTVFALRLGFWCGIVLGVRVFPRPRQ